VPKKKKKSPKRKKRNIWDERRKRTWGGDYGEGGKRHGQKKTQYFIGEKKVGDPKERKERDPAIPEREKKSVNKVTHSGRTPYLREKKSFNAKKIWKLAGKTHQKKEWVTEGKGCT